MAGNALALQHKKGASKQGLTDEENKMSIGDWAWTYHPEIFQYSKTYTRLSGSSTPVYVAGGKDDDSDEEEDSDNDL